jgi:hypothetical protein
MPPMTLETASEGRLAQAGPVRTTIGERRQLRGGYGDDRGREAHPARSDPTSRACAPAAGHADVPA